MTKPPILTLTILSAFTLGLATLPAEEKPEGPPRSGRDGGEREQAEPPRRAPGPPRGDANRDQPPREERGRGREPGPDEERERDRNLPRSPEEAERRIHHLHAAGENLAQAGLHDEARAFHERAENLERELQETREGHHPEPPHGPGEAIDRLHREVAELKEIVFDLRRQVRELEAALDRRGHERD